MPSRLCLPLPGSEQHRDDANMCFLLYWSGNALNSMAPCASTCTPPYSCYSPATAHTAPRIRVLLCSPACYSRYGPLLRAPHLLGLLNLDVHALGDEGDLAVPAPGRGGGYREEGGGGGRRGGGTGKRGKGLGGWRGGMGGWVADKANST